MGSTRKTVILVEQSRAIDVETVRPALIEGEQSGEPERFDFAAFRERKTAEHGGRTAHRCAIPPARSRPCPSRGPRTG